MSIMGGEDWCMYSLIAVVGGHSVFLVEYRHVVLYLIIACVGDDTTYGQPASDTIKAATGEL